MSLPEGWRETTLDDVVTISSSKRIFHSEYVNSGIPFYRSKEIIEKQKGNHISLELFITEEKFNEIKNKFGVPKKNDLLLTSVGTLGIPYLVKKNEIFYFKDGNLTWFKEYQNLKPLYLYYFFLSSTGKERLNEITIGSTQSALTISGLKKISINLPPLQEQKAIANILSSFDEKIELLKEENETLEQMAQGVFREWFVDIETIPANWQVTQLKDISEKISKGTTPRKKDVEGLAVTVPFLKVKDITDNGNIKISALEKIPNEVHIKALKRSILEENDLLYSIAGTIGRVAILPKELDNINCNQAVAFIRLKEKNRVLEYVHQWIQTRDIKAKIDSSIVQGVQANVSLGTLGDLEIVIPNDTILSKWNDFSKPIYEKLKNNTMQIQTLQKTRDTLLPKLMSGEVRVV